MNNLLDQIALSARNKEITIEQIVTSYNTGAGTAYEIKKNKQNNLNFVNTLGGVGFFLLFIGFGFWISNYWSTFNINQKLFISLGIGLLLFYLSYAVSFKFRNSIYSNILIIISFIWLLWGIVFGIDKFVLEYDNKNFVLSVVIFVLGIIYLFIYHNLYKSLYNYISNALLSIGTLIYGFYSLRGGSPDTSVELFNLLAIVVGISSGLFLINYWGHLVEWVRELNLFTTFSFLTGVSYSYISYNAKWISDKKIAELLFSIYFALFYFISIKAQSKVLIILNSIFLYFYLLNLSFRYISQDNFALSLIIGGFLLLLISLSTYFVSKKILKK
jgi:hypothetical protein